MTTQAAPNPIGITDTTLRDAHQSLLATRMRTEDMLPIAEKLDAIGYYSLEVWGGATFDTALRFLREDPWDRLRQIKQLVKKTPLQMLLRGQNILGYRHYADDVVERFVEKAVENGMNIFRIFDAVNDLRNLKTAIWATKKYGGHAQGTICYTTSPVHNVDLYLAQARQLADMGADSICIKDMAGLLTPYVSIELVSRIKQEITIPLVMHCHSTSGLADMAYVKAVEAGIDAIDCAISALAGGTSQPPTESMVATFRNTPRDSKLDLERLGEINDYFTEVRKKYAQFEGSLKGVDAGALTHQIPGGMISNLVSQLRELNAMDKLPQVLEEMPRVRKDMGYPPLVTPTSQIVGTQAVMNVLQGERYKVIPREVRQYVQGYYGTPPAPISKELSAKVLEGGLIPITGRPADLIDPEWNKAVADAGAMAHSDEDVLCFALFPQVTQDFLIWRSQGGREKEIVAAIVAAMSYAERRTSAIIQPTGLRSSSPWKFAGRNRQMAVRH